MNILGDISAATASTDLEYGVENKVLTYLINKNLRKYKFLSVKK